MAVAVSSAAKRIGIHIANVYDGDEVADRRRAANRQGLGDLGAETYAEFWH